MRTVWKRMVRRCRLSKETTATRAVEASTR